MTKKFDTNFRISDLAPTAQMLEESARLPLNRVERSVEGFFYVIWKGRAVFEGMQIKRFETANQAQEFLDLANRNGRPFGSP